MKTDRQTDRRHTNAASRHRAYATAYTLLLGLQFDGFGGDAVEKGERLRLLGWLAARGRGQLASPPGGVSGRPK